DGLPPPSLRSFLAMTKLCSLPLITTPCHREGRKPVAIQCEPVSEQTNPSASLETRWISASSASAPSSQ
ncbi:hypothetical protein OAQ34_08160, partial [Opitutales bacterium]|nr:hypothetical protein [Opitutales bacterium]